MVVEAIQKPFKLASTDPELRYDHLQELAEASGHIFVGQVQQKHEEVILREGRSILNHLPYVLSHVTK